MAPERPAEHLLRRARGPSSAPRSTPVSIPISSSIETRSSVAMLPVAPGGTGQPPSSPNEDSKLSTPGLQRGEHVREPLAARVVEMRGQLDARAAPRPRPRRTRAPGPGWPSRSCRRTRSRRTRSARRRARSQHPLDRHVPLVRASERGRDHALAPQSLRPRPRERPLAARRATPSTDRPTFFWLWVSDADRKPLISWKRSRSGSARSRPRSFGISTLTATTPAGSDTAASTSVGVRELRDHVGPDEARHLDPPQPGPAEQLDQPHLVRGRDHLGLVLEPVARADLADPHGAGSAHARFYDASLIDQPEPEHLRERHELVPAGAQRGDLRGQRVERLVTAGRRRSAAR